MKLTPPEGISEDDYEAIEAAVMETARGRWFLTEFARRSRIDETRQMLEAITRLEQVVIEQRTMPADPSVRLLVQRLKEVAGHLDSLAAEMRAEGYDEDVCARIDAQARSVSGLLRLNAPSPPTQAAERIAAPAAAPKPAEASRPASLPLPPRPAAMRAYASQEGEDPRLAALARLDGLPMAEKLALFS